MLKSQAHAMLIGFMMLSLLKSCVAQASRSYGQQHPLNSPAESGISFQKVHKLLRIFPGKLKSFSLISDEKILLIRQLPL